MTDAIHVQELRKSYRTSREVLKGIHLSIAAGERVALLGANGSGKTTLLRILATLLEPSSGQAWVAGQSISGPTLGIRSTLGWVPATDGGFFPKLTGRQNLEFFASLRGMKRSRIHSRLEELTRALPLEESLSTPFYLCSTGMKQLIALCRALLPAPAVLLLDEPLRAIDPDTREVLQSYFAQLPQTTLLFSSHWEAEARALATRVVRLEGGVLVE